MIKLTRLLVILPVILLYIGVLNPLLIWDGTFRLGGRVPMLLFPSIVSRIIGFETLFMMRKFETPYLRFPFVRFAGSPPA